MADGWFAQFAPEGQARELIARAHAYARDSGHQPSQIGLEARVMLEGSDPEPWLDQVKTWGELGATHVALDKRGGRLSPV